jgi:hypothetical protein
MVNLSIVVGAAARARSLLKRVQSRDVVREASLRTDSTSSA